MTKRDALRLRPGDEVLFTRSAYSIDAERAGSWTGTVIHVTPRGGIKLLVTAKGRDWHAPLTQPYEEWVPYHWVIDVTKAT